MFSKPFAVVALTIACVTAAAGGAYVAIRQNHEPARVAAAATGSVEQSQPASPA